MTKVQTKVESVRTENGFTDRTNSTVRETNLWIVNIVFQSVKESISDYKCLSV